MKTNRCSLQDRNQPQANQQGEPEQDGEEMHGIEFSSGQCLPVRLLRRPAVIKNCFSWQNYKTPTVFSKDGVDPSWILKLPFAEDSKWENTWFGFFFLNKQCRVLAWFGFVLGFLWGFFSSFICLFVCLFNEHEALHRLPAPGLDLNLNLSL